MKEKNKFIYSLILDKNTIKRALIVALIVGIILNLISNPDIFLSDFSHIVFLKVLLTFIVPFLVSLYSSVITRSKIKVGAISQLNVLTYCKSCKKNEKHFRIGEKITECPMCKSKTNWSIKEFYDYDNSEHEMVESLALFAEHNPQPLFRISHKGVIITSNIASANLLHNEKIIGLNISELLPKLNDIDFEKIIKTNANETIVISTDNKHYSFLIKGVSTINTAHIYGNNITDVILAHNKIKEQSIQLNKSIDYAWLIQKAMLPSKKDFNDIFAENFVFYRPRDIVSGDFYWITEIDNLKFLVVADSTGHGVPGAFMSMVGISFLDEIILRSHIYEPDKILNQLRKRIISSLSTSDNKSNMSNGMDLAIIVIDTEINTLSYSGAYNPLYIVRDKELLITKANSMPIGKFVKDKIPFIKHTINLQKNDIIYLFTDGYKDQFGGEDDKKYSPKAFRNLLLNISKHSMSEQKTLITEEFDMWSKGYEQLDDVTVVGIKL